MTGPFTAQANGGSLEEQIHDAHRALMLIASAAHVIAEDPSGVWEDEREVIADSIQRLALEAATRLWALSENLSPEVANWEPRDEPPEAPLLPSPRLCAVPESAS